MSRIIRDDEKEAYCVSCGKRVGYYPKDILISKSPFDELLKQKTIVCPNEKCGCHILVDTFY